MRNAFLLLAIGTLALGCVKASNVVRERAANEFNCPKEQVEVKSLGAAAYRVDACGNSATYVCTNDSGNNEAQVLPCIRESAK